MSKKKVALTNYSVLTSRRDFFNRIRTYFVMEGFVFKNHRIFFLVSEFLHDISL